MDPQLGRFAQADTMIPQSQGTQAWDRYAFVNNNPVRYTYPTGHYAKEEIHYDLIYAIVYQLAYAKLMSRGYSESAATVVAQSLADRIASADAGVDSKESPIPKPGT